MSKPKTDRIPYTAVDGILLLDKPKGPTSNTALQMARRFCLAKKAGHTGTLDPMASGLLPICFGEATKFSQIGLDADKTYLATIKLGEATTTADGEGEVISTALLSSVDESRLLSVLTGFIGEIEQVPPMYSALKYQGRPLYDYARSGQTIERATRKVIIYSLNCLTIDLPFVQTEVRCSKGTYIRTLASDIGEQLGCGAHLVSLRRTMAGQFHIGQAVTLSALEDMPSPRDCLLPIDRLLMHLPKLIILPKQASRLYFGQTVIDDERFSGLDSGQYRLYMVTDKEVFIGLGEVVEGKTLQSVRLLNKMPES